MVSLLDRDNPHRFRTLDCGACCFRVGIEGGLSLLVPMACQSYGQPGWLTQVLDDRSHLMLCTKHHQESGAQAISEVLLRVPASHIPCVEHTTTIPVVSKTPLLSLV